MFLGSSKFCGTDTKLFFAIILFDLVWIAEVKFATLAFAMLLAISWHMNENLCQGCK